MEYGFEVEYFVRDKKGNYCLVPSSIPADECGYLAEARGKPSSNLIEAAYLLQAAIYHLGQSVHNAGLEYGLFDGPTIKLPLTLVREALREHGKNPVPRDRRGNIYNREYSKLDNYQRAGLHVHFSNTLIHEQWTGNGFIDMGKIIPTLDKAFADEIRKARRIPGLYELKPYGFEYRSLPATTNPIDVAQVLRKILIW